MSYGLTSQDSHETVLHNFHVYSDENPRVTRSASFQRRFRVNVSAGILGITLIGSFSIEDSMRGEDYLNFVEDVVRSMLNDMPLQSRHQYMVSTIRCSSIFHTSGKPVVRSEYSR